ncbi:MAG TPA: transketolase [Clostridia bacterium]
MNLSPVNIRKLVKRAIMFSGGGHAGGSLSMAEILCSLYGEVMVHDPKNPQLQNRDRLILSKGHSGLGLYAALALCGYFPVEDLDKFGTDEGYLMNHPSAYNTPGVEMSTGSLGHGLPISCGIALSAKMRDEKHFVYCILGDAELQEGTVWEAAMMASQYKLKRLVAIVDRNKIGNDSLIDGIVSVEPLTDKWKSFGWKVYEADGHNQEEITKCLKEIKQQANGPYVVIAHTIKGKGLVEGVAGTGRSHYIKGSPALIADLFEPLPIESE